METIEILQHKDGVLTERIRTGEGTAIRKTFDNSESTREITNYHLLSRLNIPTLRVLSHTENAITLEDIAASDHWRLGVSEDLSDPTVAAAIARWYKKFHGSGRGVVTEDMYDESHLFTLKNIRFLRSFTKTQDSEYWNVLENHFPTIRTILDRVPKTLAYNDFYWTNLAVSKDHTEALMFDYNLMGKCYAYSDIHNVTVSMSPEAAAAFLAEYGPIDPLEQALHDVLSPITSLILAARRGIFPDWAKECLDELPDIPDRIQTLPELSQYRKNPHTVPRKIHSPPPRSARSIHASGILFLPGILRRREGVLPAAAKSSSQRVTAYSLAQTDRPKNTNNSPSASSQRNKT